MESSNDKSTIATLWGLLTPIILNVPKIVKGFFKERHYLHFAAGALSGFVISLLPQTDALPFVIKIIFGWIAGYIPNFAWEHYFARRGNRFDINDVFAGAYGGLIYLAFMT